jgi:hypothetical protein
VSDFPASDSIEEEFDFDPNTDGRTWINTELGTPKAFKHVWVVVHGKIKREEYYVSHIGFWLRLTDWGAKVVSDDDTPTHWAYTT